jgi:hypothetical protein
MRGKYIYSFAGIVDIGIANISVVNIVVVNIESSKIKRQAEIIYVHVALAPTSHPAVS